MRIQWLFLCVILFAILLPAQTIYLDELNLSAMECGWGTPEANKSVGGNSLKVGGQIFNRGVGTHAVSTLLMNLDGKGKRFTSSFGLDDEVADGKGTIKFFIIGDRKILWQSPVMKKGDKAEFADVDLTNIKLLGLLVTDGGDDIDYDHADWCDAKIEFTSKRKPDELVVKTVIEPYILTPKPSDSPKINGAKIFGVRPGNPFLYTIAATGKRPMKFFANNLPVGLLLDNTTGIITGKVDKECEYNVTLIVQNDLGDARRELRIKVGKQIALTPPMGWNSWNCWACAVDDAKVRTSADAMVSSGLINHGWTYINIDDCWEIKPDAKEPELQGELRNKDGMINTNKKFPDMKLLGDYVHSKGLKLGIYSGPGPLTCAGFTASYQFEIQDAKQYAEWGIDYLKYDWCSYGKIAKDQSLPELKKPYQVMRDALDKVPRDIVYSLCQYGMGNVWEWGEEVGGNCWRTTGDITDTWSSMSGIGFNQAGHEKFAGPGHWNDPDMLVVGLVGWGPNLHPTKLTPDEQYTHISLWSLLCSPLLIGADMSRLDDFTLNLLTNDEVIEINQDPLGIQARRIFNEDGKQIWIKEMEDDSKAVGLFFADAGKREPVDYFQWDIQPKKTKIVLKGSDIGINGKFSVRDVWRQKDIGVFENQFEADIPYHGVILIKCKSKN
ncbi:MAG: NPCBM/NEW2 domain-containing protein [Ignavibacteriales bacterium]|nr:NPCBM/NEW2 domain-containing protein [Ignavibacteriales bacterium]